jgi:hypothetical protein
MARPLRHGLGLILITSYFVINNSVNTSENGYIYLSKEEGNGYEGFGEIRNGGRGCMPKGWGVYHGRRWALQSLLCSISMALAAAPVRHLPPWHHRVPTVTNASFGFHLDLQYEQAFSLTYRSI